MPEYSSGELEFTVDDHKVVEDSKGRVYKIKFFTDDVEGGVITTKPTTEDTFVEDGIKKQKDRPATYDELPDPVIETLQESLDGEIKVSAHVTQATDSDGTNFFINDYNLDTLETRVFVDEGEE